MLGSRFTRHGPLGILPLAMLGVGGEVLVLTTVAALFADGVVGEAELDAARGVSFALSGGVGILMALYCLTLPHTPPVRDERHKYAPGVVMTMLRHTAVPPTYLSKVPLSGGVIYRLPKKLRLEHVLRRSARYPFQKSRMLKLS